MESQLSPASEAVQLFVVPKGGIAVVEAGAYANFRVLYSLSTSGVPTMRVDRLGAPTGFGSVAAASAQRTKFAQWIDG